MKKILYVEGMVCNKDVYKRQVSIQFITKYQKRPYFSKTNPSIILKPV